MVLGGIIWSVLEYYELSLITVQQLHIAAKSHADVLSLQNCDVDASGKCNEVSRVERIKIMCSKFRVKDRIVDSNLFLASNDTHRVLYCPMHKVGSTTFLSLMYDRQNWKRARDLSVNRTTLSKDEMEYRLKNYFKFMVVRHPFDRLLSAYLDKFSAANKIYAKQYAKVLHSKFGGQLEIDSKGIAFPTFEQFLYLVLTEPVTFRNHHWLNYNDYCHPCFIQYDYVVYMETFEDDIDIILGHFDSDGSRFELPVNGYVRRARKDRLQETSAFFKKIDRRIIDKLLSVYRQDFQVFGYTWNYSTGAGCVKGVC